MRRELEFSILARSARILLTEALYATPIGKYPALTTSHRLQPLFLNFARLAIVSCALKNGLIPRLLDVKCSF